MSNRYRPMHAFSRMIEAGVHPVIAFNQTDLFDVLRYQCSTLGKERQDGRLGEIGYKRVLANRFTLLTSELLLPSTAKDGGFEDISLTAFAGTDPKPTQKTAILRARMIHDFRRVAMDSKGQFARMVVSCDVTSNLALLRQFERSAFNVRHAANTAAIRELEELNSGPLAKRPPQPPVA